MQTVICADISATTYKFKKTVYNVISRFGQESLELLLMDCALDNIKGQDQAQSVESSSQNQSSIELNNDAIKSQKTPKNRPKTGDKARIMLYNESKDK